MAACCSLLAEVQSCSGQELSDLALRNGIGAAAHHRGAQSPAPVKPSCCSPMLTAVAWREKEECPAVCNPAQNPRLLGSPLRPEQLCSGTA
ncbi:hypothetical protein COCON_G00033250 [Conger conger]|uniref:Uncharacterized protein n=1 Tax=Conger conger TaxID=82655 RepID=A0A9Q1I7C7_CONCO|nr:hypothetical protein COCON_G00033250 [Conger conger]